MQWWKTHWLELFKRTFKAFGKDQCSRLAASLAYYAVFSIFPLVLLMISILGFWLRFQGSAGQEEELMNQLLNSIRSNVSADLAETLKPILVDIKLQAGSSASLALVTTLFAASGIFVQLDNAFDTIWNVQPAEDEGMLATIRHKLLERGKAFLMVLAIGVLLIASVVLTAVINGIQSRATDITLLNNSVLWFWLSFVISLILTMLVFSLLFYTLPKPKLRWRDVLPAAIVTAILWEVGKQILSAYLGGNRYTASATVTAFIALLAWVYYASMILFFGAEFSQAYTLMHREQKEVTELLKLPPPPDAPAVGIRGPEISQQQKTAYATGGIVAGAVGTVVLTLVGAIVAVAMAILRLFRRS